MAFIDLLGEALRSIRQGSDPRLELELVLIKMTAAHASGLREEPARWTETGGHAPAPAAAGAAPAPQPAASPRRRRTRRRAGAARPRGGPPTSRRAGADGPGAAPERDSAPEAAAAEAAAPTSRATAGAARGHGMPADIDHLRRAWPLVLEAVKKRQTGLSAVLAEGRPESLDGDTLVIKFPAGYSFQADMVARGENPQVISRGPARGHRQATCKVVARVAVQEQPEPEPRRRKMLES